MPSFQIRPAAEQDIPVILELVRGIAEYEKLLDQLEATEGRMHEALFGERPAARGLIAEHETDGPVGYAIFCYNFSTFVGKAGIYLEDLYVKPEYRGHGMGKALFKAVAQVALDEDCGRMEWVALDWNTPALEFYKSQGAQCLGEWQLHRFNEEQLKAATK
ncbi:GNAT family N-acetyltransferase [Pelagicoccus mobilis]|uniref:GNAT family N-acetyltransferase n=1 Tax=Pelagicoccus mobilis TaxID=415221 RepID=A0A934RZS9_9BACT|nr:GNAT family N-acetyltransferase [Pelagicoccus mobilis]MBK1877906.1 GNAT family N-acetyltransferase [Pelagicoccus mobilis]